jgi:ribosomal protein S18 acetylase RimI-like enzyme
MLLPENEKLLNLDPISNMSMLGFFAKHNPIKTLSVGDSFMAHGKSDEDWWYLSCKNLDDFDWFLNQTGKDDSFLAVIDDSMLNRVKSRFTCRWTLSCIRFYLPSNIVVPKPSLSTSELLITDAEHIYTNSNYKTYTTVEYIREQIAQGESSAFRQGQTLAGWVLTHDDGAMGMLHVLDFFRRKGIARALVIDLIKKIRKMGITPFTYVEPSNTASMELVKSLGFIPDRPIHWVCLNR